MSLSTQPYKGTRDFYPEDKRLQKYIFGIMRVMSERFGFEEIDSPLIEPLELYKAKTGDEIVDEQTYSFTDRGGREVAIRPEMTPTVSRMVAARRQELAYPLRWYSIANLWRYERPQRGRLREHWQLNVDIFGVKDLSAEHEIISIADSIMQAYGAKSSMYVIKLNSRRLTNAIFGDYLNVSQVQAATLARLIDRVHKIDHAAFVAEIDALFTPTQREEGLSNKLLQILEIKSLSQLPPELANHDSAKELVTLLELLDSSGITNATFDVTIMRGFDYYTDIVFEVFDTDAQNNRSLFGGGRYDGLVGLFGVEPVATVGFGMGDVTIANFLETHQLIPKTKVETDIYVILVGDVINKAKKTIDSLREMGLNIAVDSSGRKPGDQIKNALKKGIHYVLFIGEKELEQEQFTLKNLITGVEEQHSPQRIVSIVKDYREQ